MSRYCVYGAENTLLPGAYFRHPLSDYTEEMPNIDRKNKGKRISRQNNLVKSVFFLNLAISKNHKIPILEL